MVLLLTLAVLAHASPPAPAAPGADITDIVSFTIDRCERVRARWIEDRPPDTPRADRLVIKLENTGDEACHFRGISLLGSLDGTYSSSDRGRERAPDDTSFSLAPGAAVSFRIHVRDRTAPREVVELQIPPERGVVVFIGKERAPASDG